MLFQQFVTSIVVSNFGNYSCLSTVYYYMPCFASTSGQDELFLKWCKESSVDSPELVDFAIRLVNSVFNFPKVK